MEFSKLDNHARVWVYQADRFLNPEEVAIIKSKGEIFSDSWASHGNSLKAAVTVKHGLFLIVAVDEKQAMASGCSIDKGVQFVKKMGEELNVDFFNRLNFAWMEDEKVFASNQQEFADYYKNEKISDNTMVFNNMVDSVEKLQRNWLLPLSDSWHARFV